LTSARQRKGKAEKAERITRGGSSYKKKRPHKIHKMAGKRGKGNFSNRGKRKREGNWSTRETSSKEGITIMRDSPKSRGGGRGG